MRTLFLILSILVSGVTQAESDRVGELLTQVKSGPNINSPCPPLEQEETDESEAEEDTPIIPVLSLELRNDVFVSPFMAIRNRYFYLWDMGETHGGKVEAGFKIPKWGEVTLKYTTRLFAKSNLDATFEYYRKPPQSNSSSSSQTIKRLRIQEFTSEQLYTLAYQFPSRDKGFNYSVEIGLIEYESKNDRNFLNGSTQQRVLHNSSEDLTDIRNLNSKSSINGKGIVIIPKAEKIYNYGENFSLTPYVMARLTSIYAANNATLGVSGEWYFKHSSDLSSRIKIDVPITFYISDDDQPQGIFTRPSLSASVKWGSARLGFRYDIPFGNFQENIPQNVPTFNTDDLTPGRTISDIGEMGTIFFEINK